MPRGNSQAHGGKDRSCFASGIERLVDLVCNNGDRAPTGAGGKVAIDSSEASDAANKALVVIVAEVSAGGDRYLSAKLMADVTGESMMRNFLANIDLISRLHDSGPDGQRSTGLALSVVLRRFGDDDNKLW